MPWPNTRPLTSGTYLSTLRNVSTSISRFGWAAPIALMWVPGEMWSPSITGSGASVATMTISTSETASALDETASASTPRSASTLSANSIRLDSVGENTSTVSISRTVMTASSDDRAICAEPTTPTLLASSVAKNSVPTPATAPVFAGFQTAPSRMALSSPVSTANSGVVYQTSL